MDWVWVMSYGSNLLTSLHARKFVSFLFQNIYYHIPLERFFHTDSKIHHDIHLKMDWVRKISHRSNLQTRTAPGHTKSIFISKTWNIIYHWKGILILILKLSQHASQKGLGPSYRPRDYFTEQNGSWPITLTKSILRYMLWYFLESV